MHQLSGKAASGSITFDKIQMDYQRADKAAIQAIRLRTAMVFQQFNVFKNMTVLENVMDPLVVVQRKSKDEARALRWKRSTASASPRARITIRHSFPAVSFSAPALRAPWPSSRT